MPMIRIAPFEKKLIGSILILILLPLLLYFNSLQGSFHFDDRNLIDRKWISDLDAFKKNVDLLAIENRPVLLWTFALNNTLHKNRVFGFHLANLLLHIFVSILIFAILMQTGNRLRQASHGGDGSTHGSPEYRAEPSLPELPLFAALLFSVHPLNTDSVSYISSRSTLLTTFFYLLTLYFFLRIFLLHNNRWRKIRQWALGILIIGGMYLALASKLIAVTIPVLLVLWFLMFICPGNFPEPRLRLFSRKRVAVYSSLLALLLAGVFLTDPDFIYTPKDQGLDFFGRIPYFLVQTKVVIFYYLKLFITPINLNVDTGFPFTAFFADLDITGSMLVIAGLIYFAWKSGNPWVRAGVIWFFITLMPTSSLVPLNDLAVEHRMYLPMTLGLCLVAGWAVARMPAGGGPRLMVVLISLFGLLTVSRNLVWTDEVRLWQDAVKKNPTSSRTHNNLGKAFYEEGRIDQALFHFLRSNENIQGHLAKQYNLGYAGTDLQKRTGFSDEGKRIASLPVLKANLAEPHYNLASVYLDKGNLEQAELEYQAAIRLNPDYFSALLGLGSVFARRGQVDRAIDSLRMAIQKRKSVSGEEDYPLARLNLGDIYGRIGKYEDAIRELSLAVKFDPSLVLGHYNLGLAHLMTGQLNEAEQAIQNCLSLNPGFEPALFNLARVTQAKGQWARSTRQFETFLEVKGADSRAYFQIGWNHQQAGNLEEAGENYETALSLKPDFLNARINLGKIYFDSQKPELARKHLRRALQSSPPSNKAEEISILLRKLS